MKIAFVGKGGSGKSTVSALFIQYLLQNGSKTYVFDADINQHLAGLLGITFDKDKSLSSENHVKDIRQYLIGQNERIGGVAKMIKTTPPGTGSNLITFDDKDHFANQYGTRLGSHGSRFFHVGTYTSDGIGASCYHTNLSLFENVLSHTVAHKDDWLIADMVAGTDAFAGALHKLFDVFALVIEPTPESTGVYMQFMELAKAAGIEERVMVIGNKIEDGEDLKYINKIVDKNMLAAAVPYSPTLRRARQNGQMIKADDTTKPILEIIAEKSRQHYYSPLKHYEQIVDQHKKFSTSSFALKKYGDLSGQIDMNFNFPEKDNE